MYLQEIFKVYMFHLKEKISSPSEPGARAERGEGRAERAARRVAWKIGAVYTVPGFPPTSSTALAKRHAARNQNLAHKIACKPVLQIGTLLQKNCKTKADVGFDIHSGNRGREHTGKGEILCVKHAKRAAAESR